jgi:hypothetical protein
VYTTIVKCNLTYCESQTGKTTDHEVKNMCMHTPGFMKSERPKSVALRGESSFVDLNRKFYTPVRLLATPFSKKY